MGHATTTKYVIIAAILSVGLHLVFIGAADRLRIPVLDISEKEEKEEKRIHISSMDVRERVQRRRTTAADSTETTDMLAAHVSQKKIKDVFREENLLPDPKPKLELRGVGDKSKTPKQKGAADGPQEASAPRPSIVSIDAESVRKGGGNDGNGSSRRYIAKEERTEVSGDRNIPSLVDAGPLRPAKGGRYQASMRLDLPDAGEMDIGKGPGQLAFDGDRTEAEEMTFEPIEGGGAPTVSDSRAGKRERTSKEQVQKMHKLLNVSLTTATEADGGGTFRVDIAPNPKSDLLGAISKDILFLIDSSTSVSPRKFRYFKSATRQVLQYLHPEDRFNIVSFKVSPHKLFPKYQEVNDANLQQAEKFLDKLSRGGLTDVYGGLAPCIEDTRSVNDQRPAIVFLMTDGQSTVKNKHQNDELIRKIVQLNEDNASIYCFSTGSDVNRFLLDFLAYNNQGTALHAKEIKNFEEQLANFIRQHSELIVQNLSFQLAGHSEGTIYPKELPHLYRDEILSIYGRFNPDTEQIGIRLTGRDAGDKLSELVYKGDVDDAQDAGTDLRLDWAAQKVFHLIAQRTLNPEKKGINERIRALAKKYNLYVPYL